MLYILLIIIIILLCIIIYSNREGVHFRKLFSDEAFKHVKDYVKDENLSKAHPEEYVRFMNRYMERREADRLEDMLNFENSKQE